MGKAKALKLGIQKGVAHVIKPILPKSLKCPICKIVFPIETGEQADEMAEHVDMCIRAMYPNHKSACYLCEKGKNPFKLGAEKLKYTIDELHVHMKEVHGEDWGSGEELSIDGESPTTSGTACGPEGGERDENRGDSESLDGKSATLRESEPHCASGDTEQSR